MTAVQVIVLWGGVAICASLLAAALAGAKNRDWSSWAAWSFLLPPAVVVLAMLPRFRGERRRRMTQDEIDALES